METSKQVFKSQPLNKLEFPMGSVKRAVAPSWNSGRRANVNIAASLSGKLEKPAEKKEDEPAAASARLEQISDRKTDFFPDFRL